MLEGGITSAGGEVKGARVRKGVQNRSCSSATGGSAGIVGIVGVHGGDGGSQGIESVGDVCLVSHVATIP